MLDKYMLNVEEANSERWLRREGLMREGSLIKLSRYMHDRGFTVLLCVCRVVKAGQMCQNLYFCAKICFCAHKSHLPCIQEFHKHKMIPRNENSLWKQYSFIY